MVEEQNNLTKTTKRSTLHNRKYYKGDSSMKKLAKIMLAVVFLLLIGCRTTIYVDGVILAVESKSDGKEQVEVVYKAPNGVILEKIIDQSKLMSDGKRTVDPRDYLPKYCKEKCLEFRPYPGNSDALVYEYWTYINKYGYH
jgi:hypothetical protein